MEAPSDANTNIVTAASLAPPDEIAASAGAHPLSHGDSGDRIATEGWVLAQLDAFKNQLFTELNVQFGNFLRQSAGLFATTEGPIITLGEQFQFDKEEVVVPVLRELVKTHKFPSSDMVKNRVIAQYRKLTQQHQREPIDEDKLSGWLNANQRWLATKMRELRSTDNKQIRKVFSRVYPEKPKDYMNYPQRWEQFKKECMISTPAEEAWAHIVIEVQLNDSTLGKVGELEVYKRFRQKLGDDTALPPQREKPKTKRMRTSSSSAHRITPKKTRSSSGGNGGLLGKDSKDDDDDGLDTSLVHDASSTVAPHHHHDAMPTPPKDSM